MTNSRYCGFVNPSWPNRIAETKSAPFSIGYVSSTPELIDDQQREDEDQVGEQVARGEGELLHGGRVCCEGSRVPALRAGAG